MEYCYLASPYSHKHRKVMERRYHQVVEVAAFLMANDKVIFCPIAHSHPIGLVLDSPTDHAFWERQDMPLLVHASSVIVLCLDGWKESRGVQREIAIARDLGIPVDYMDYEDILP